MSHIGSRERNPTRRLYPLSVSLSLLLAVVRFSALCCLQPVEWQEMEVGDAVGDVCGSNARLARTGCGAISNEGAKKRLGLSHSLVVSCHNSGKVANAVRSYINHRPTPQAAAAMAVSASDGLRTDGRTGGRLLAGWETLGRPLAVQQRQVEHVLSMLTVDVHRSIWMLLVNVDVSKTAPA